MLIYTGAHIRFYGLRDPSVADRMDTDHVNYCLQTCRRKVQKLARVCRARDRVGNDKVTLSDNIDDLGTLIGESDPVRIH